MDTDEKKDGQGNPIKPEGLYYIQERRTIVGNCMLWWCPNGQGYTTELNKAGQYYGFQVMDKRDTDIPWPVEYIESKAVRHVRLDMAR